MLFRKFAIAAFAASLTVGTANAEAPVGLWKSAADSTGLVVHVRTKPCGRALCGRIERAKDRRGYDTPSRAVGKLMLHGFLPQEDGTFAGQIWDRRKNRMLSARMKVDGNTLRLSPCDGDKCREIVWTRLR